MQALLLKNESGPYTVGMNTGRPAKRERTAFGARLHALREAAGLSQQDVAARLGITQPAYALWERRNVSVRVDQLCQVAKIFKVPVEDLFYEPSTARQRGGPIGKARKVFEEVSQLPRNRQQRIVSVVEDMLAAAR